MHLLPSNCLRDRHGSDGTDIADADGTGRDGPTVMIVASAEERIKSELRDSVVVVPEIQYLAQASSQEVQRTFEKPSVRWLP